MRLFHRIARYPLCCCGMHVLPAKRHPRGPVVADCACCGRAVYYYALSIHEANQPPVLSLRAPVRIISSQP